MSVFRDLELEEDLAFGAIDPKVAERVFDDLSTYLKKPIEIIAKEYWNYRKTEDTKAQEVVAKATEASTVAEYYQQAWHYLYELSYWEACRDKQSWYAVLARACRKHRLQSILDYGGGVGGVSLYLARRGLNPGHLDIPGKTSAYASWRFQRHGFKIPIFDALLGPPREPFDAVVAWDVLEHVFDLGETIAGISRVLPKGGWMISKSTFAEEHDHQFHIHLAKHAPYQDVAKFNALIAQQGFRYLGQLKPDRFSRLLRVCGIRHAVMGTRISPRLKHGGNFLVHQRLG